MSRKSRSGFTLVPGGDIDDHSRHRQIEQFVNMPGQSAGRQSLASVIPPIMPLPPPYGDGTQTGVYHPELMFCAPCSSCQDTGSDNTATDDQCDGQGGTVSSLTPSANASSQSRFQLSNSQLNPSEILILQSLLESLPGLSNVSIAPSRQFIVVEHDASMNNEKVFHALESIGHEAIIQDSTFGSTSQEQWVRSQFYVSGICCTSEVPAIKRILKPVPGVAKLQINVTTKVVHAHHDVAITSAKTIAETLSRQGFPTKIQRDGHAQSRPLHKTLLQGQTKLAVNGDISEEDRPRIEQKLGRLGGVAKIDLDVREGLILVDHDVYLLSSEQIVNELQPSFECVVIAAGERSVDDDTARTLDEIRRSKYVESTVAVERLDAKLSRIMEETIYQTYGRNEVRAVYPNVVSETMKIEHDPRCVSIDELVDTLARHDCKAAVTLDGAILNLYLPAGQDPRSLDIQEQDEASLMKVHLNVWLSGVFWVLSMLSYKEELDDFKYFGLASVIFGLPPICVKAWRTVRRCQFDANCMMVTAALGALSLQQYDEAGSVAFLFSVSEYLEAQASTKARNALKSICDLRPDHANVIHPVTKEIVVVPAQKVPMGALISVKPGDKIAADGMVVDGSSSVDESSLTGESVPIEKHKGDPVKGGTINIGRTQLVVRTTTTAEDSAVSRLIRLVEDAQSNRSPTEKLIDSFARSYTPSVMFVALLMCTLPWLSGVENGRHWMLNGLIIVVIACPCSLTISTPVTYAAGLAATAQRGIIIKGGAKLEALGSVDKIVFDKTGTLTKGQFSVVHLEVVGTSIPRQEMLGVLALIQERSSHPVAACLVKAAKDEGAAIPRHKSLSNHTILKGEGVSAEVDGATVFIGNQRLFERLGAFSSLGLNHKDLVRAWSGTGSMVGFVGTMNDGIIGIFCVKDAIREEARSVVQHFQDAYIDTMICTGDSDAVAQAVAREVGIPPVCVHSQLLPEDKLHFVGSLKRAQPKNYALCREKRYVLYCGDGVNDAPALAVSDIGCSMGEGAAMAMEMSDITLMDSNLSKLSFAMNMGQRVLRTVKENILISLVGKLVVIALTFTGKMTLLLAIASDVGIMLIVTINGMKLLTSGDYIPPTPQRTSGSLLPYKGARHGITTEVNSETIELASLSDCALV